MKISTYYHQDYSGGLNDTDNPEEIKRNEASRLENWHIRSAGKLVKRKGLSQLGNTMTDSFDGMASYLRTGGGKDLLIVEGGSLRYLNSSTFDELDSGFTSTKEMSFAYCPIDDKLYMCNGTDDVHSWDRASTTLNSCLTAHAVGSGQWKANVLIWHKNHMFYLNGLTNGTNTYNDGIGWSDMGAPTTCATGADYARIPGGGNVITAGNLGDALVIFKERSISFLTGWGDSDWQISGSSSNVANTDEQVGIAGKWAHTRVGNELWFMDEEGQIRRLYQTDFDAFRRDIISTKIQGTIEGLNKTQLSKCYATTWNNYVLFSVPNGTDTENSIVLAFDIIASKRTGEEAWETWTGWTASYMLPYPTSSDVALYIADRTNKKVYNHTGYSDDSTAIASRWDGKKDDYDKPERHKRYFYGYTSGPAIGDIDIGIHAKVDGSVYGKATDLNLSSYGTALGPTGAATMGPTGTWILGGGGEREKKFYYQDTGGAVGGKSITHSIRHAVDAEQAEINTFTSHYKQRKLR
jgi:hypothetical protein